MYFNSYVVDHKLLIDFRKDYFMAHRKYYNSNGIEVPSVTEIVKMLHKPELDSWANWMGLVKRVNVNDYLAQKAEYGSYCHDLFENFFMGFLTKKFCDYKFVTDKEFLSIIQKFEYIKSRFNQLGIEIINMELGLDGERFGGTLDMLAYSKLLNRVFLFDLKTSKAMYQSHLIQTGGYSILLEEKYGISVTDVGIILLSKPIGNDMIHIIPRDKNKRNEDIFNHLVDIYHIQKGD